MSKASEVLKKEGSKEPNGQMLERAKELVKKYGRSIVVRDILMEEFTISKWDAGSIASEAIQLVLNNKKEDKKEDWTYPYDS